MSIVLILGCAALAIIVAAFAFGGDDLPNNSPTANKARIALAAIIAVVAVASVAFRWISGYGLQQSAALFVGIPAILAIAAVFSPSPRSATGVACKAVSIGLLVSLIFLGEGMLCVLMSAPLFYLVAIVVGLAVDYLRRDSKRAGGTVMSCVALLALVPMSDLVRQAAATLEPVELRTLVAIHLASAMTLGNDPAAVITYDQRMTTAAAALGLQVAAPA